MILKLKLNLLMTMLFFAASVVVYYLLNLVVNYVFLRRIPFINSAPIGFICCVSIAMFFSLFILRVENKSIFNDLKIGVENAIENTRLVSYKLIPPLLDKYGLEVALDDLIKRLNTNSKIQYSFICDQKNLPISSLVAYEMYRILQEFTTNIGKYGASTICSISLHKKQNFVEMLIKNDGKTYDFYEELKNSKGLGLKNIESRVKVIEGKLIQLNSSEGNIISITIPLISN